MTQEEKDTLIAKMMKDPYEQTVQYASIKGGIRAHAEIYSFNIESELFNQLSKEQQALWRKEIERACISGGDVGVELARDTRYKENLEANKVNLELFVRRIINLYLDAGKHYDEVIANESKKQGSSDLAIKSPDDVIDVNELCIQYILDKLNAKK